MAQLSMEFHPLTREDGFPVSATEETDLATGVSGGNNKVHALQGLFSGSVGVKAHSCTETTLGRKPKKCNLVALWRSGHSGGGGGNWGQRLGFLIVHFSIFMSYFVCSSKRPCTYNVSFNASGLLPRKPT